jgi:hypothetical protein
MLRIVLDAGLCAREASLPIDPPKRKRPNGKCSAPHTYATDIHGSEISHRAGSPLQDRPTTIDRRHQSRLHQMSPPHVPWRRSDARLSIRFSNRDRGRSSRHGAGPPAIARTCPRGSLSGGFRRAFPALSDALRHLQVRPSTRRCSLSVLPFLRVGFVSWAHRSRTRVRNTWLTSVSVLVLITLPSRNFASAIPTVSVKKQNRSPAGHLPGPLAPGCENLIAVKRSAALARQGLAHRRFAEAKTYQKAFALLELRMRDE